MITCHDAHIFRRLVLAVHRRHVRSIRHRLAKALLSHICCLVTLLVDTGSSNTWVGADQSNPFVVTST